MSRKFYTLDKKSLLSIQSAGGNPINLHQNCMECNQKSKSQKGIPQKRSMKKQNGENWKLPPNR